jgi:hypothetical protein
MALICLGISGGTTLVHTDDLASLRTFHAGHSVLGHAGGDSSDSACLACQWEASVYNPHIPIIHVACPPAALMPLQASHFEAVAPRPFGHTSPRAPPCAPVRPFLIRVSNSF